MMLKQAFYILGFVVAGSLLSTLLAFFNGTSPCEIYGFCQPKLIQKNQQLLEQIAQLKLDLIKANTEADQKLTKVEELLAKEQQRNTDIQASIEKIITLNQQGDSSERIRNIAQQLVEIASILRESN